MNKQPKLTNSKKVMNTSSSKKNKNTSSNSKKSKKKTDELEMGIVGDSSFLAENAIDPTYAGYPASITTQTTGFVFNCDDQQHSPTLSQEIDQIYSKPLKKSMRASNTSNISNNNSNTYGYSNKTYEDHEPDSIYPTYTQNLSMI